MSIPFHGLTTQVGYFAPGSVPGVPDMVTISLTPSRPARRMAARMSSACLSPSLGSGEVGLPEVLRPESVIPLSLKTPRYSSRAVGEASRASTGQCGEGMNPPTLTSAPVSPASLRTSRASGRERSWRQAV